MNGAGSPPLIDATVYVVPSVTNWYPLIPGVSSIRVSYQKSVCSASG